MADACHRRPVMVVVMRRRGAKLRGHRALDLDRATRGDDGSRHHRCHVRGSSSQNRGARAGGSASGNNAAPGSTRRRSATGTASGADQPGQYSQGPKDRSESSKLAADAAELGAVLPASATIV